MSLIGRPTVVGQVPLEQLLDEHEEFARIVYHRGVTNLIPKDPALRIQVFIGELSPGGATPWHMHNGTALFVVTHGSLRVERRDGGLVNAYGPGSFFYEPVGEVHRGANQSKWDPCTAFGVKFTPPHMEHDTYTEPIAVLPNRRFRADHDHGHDDDHDHGHDDEEVQP